ncbi:thiol reductant ABC exporter subunit CydD [Janibacter sp. GXQ6167]|uniref:thiol reductant ABC exporter subunit CydD n=1 Tax=Janibacter sp. GXQ6167 TaxID=3240791 RepID=UPI003526B3BC
MKPFDPRLLRVAPETRRPVVVLGLLGAGQGLATIGTAFALTALVVAVVRQQPLLIPALATGGLFAARGLLGYLLERVAAWAGAEISTSLRERLLATWATRDADSRPDRAAALTLAAQGTASVEPYVARFLPSLIIAAIVPPLAIVTLLIVDWPAALVVILTVPLLPLFAALIGMTTRDETQQRWAALSALSGHFLDVMRGLPTLVSYGRGERQVTTIERVSDRHRVATMRTLRLAFMSSAALELLATISVAIVAVLVGIRLTHGSMELPVAMVAILLAPEAYWPIRRVGAEFHSAADGAEALDAILAELEAEPTDPPAEKGAELAGVVRARGISYTYPGTSRPVIHDLDATATSGLTAVTGPSGVGKTTLLEILAGTRLPQEGTVETGQVHLVTQRPFLGAGTIADNLTLGNDAGHDAIWSALRAVGLDGVVAALPEGLATVIGDDGFGLSAGQRARLVLARALLSPASIILMDEPTAHLDPAATDAIHHVITQMAQTRTVIVVTHRSELLALADHHLHLRAPALVEGGEVR